MASIRTITFGDAEFKWDTGRLRDVAYNHDNIKRWYKSYIKPRLKINDYYDIRKCVFDLVKNAIKSQDIKSMEDFTNLIMALRLTLIDENSHTDDGYLNIMFMVPSEYYEKITFYNIPWHINHHCRQLYQFCFVQVRRKYSNDEISISYTTGEWKDRKWDGIDKVKMKDNKSYRRKN